MHGQTCGSNAITGGGMVKVIANKPREQFGLAAHIKPNRHERRKAKARKK